MEKSPFEDDQHFYLEGKFVKKTTYYEDKEKSDKETMEKQEEISNSLIRVEQTFKIISRIFTVIMAPIIIILVSVLIDRMIG